MIKIELSLEITDLQKKNPRIYRADNSTLQPNQNQQPSRKDLIKAGITRCIDSINNYINKGLTAGWKGIRKTQN
jgi:hypothetical protein